jgi:2-hydroxychromene-2-carboxylate isomerase
MSNPDHSYFRVMWIQSEAEPRGLRIAWKPFLLGPIFRALGFEKLALTFFRGK